MFIRNIHLAAVCLVMSMATAPAARAQWAVVDAPAIVQLIQQVQDMEKELAIAANQLQTAQQGVQAMTGNRGMDRLLGGTQRNYLPTNWAQLTNAVQRQGTSGYPGLSRDVQDAMAANAVLSPQRLATLSPGDQQQIQAARQAAALQQALTAQALANASSRFAAIQSLITAIPTATDQKAILELQARIAAEQGMLQNEQTKLQILHQATLAQESSIRQQERERVIAAHGRFEDRFQPVP